uniref:Uncharacterized protein n=1 Tax=Globisporangium ultimum (strain ATCC 200006 / CBS 805.95 / DAOM BR144) TaxID=431595 RepID=K3X5I7_GLOUD
MAKMQHKAVSVDWGALRSSENEASPTGVPIISLYGRIDPLEKAQHFRGCICWPSAPFF